MMQKAIVVSSTVIEKVRTSPHNSPTWTLGVADAMPLTAYAGITARF
jgi:hypothetical protein